MPRNYDYTNLYKNIGKPGSEARTHAAAAVIIGEVLMGPVKAEGLFTGHRDATCELLVFGKTNEELRDYVDSATITFMDENPGETFVWKQPDYPQLRSIQQSALDMLDAAMIRSYGPVRLELPNFNL